MNKQQIRTIAEGVAEGQFYCDDERTTVWEPFENYDEEWVHEQVQSLADSIENAITYVINNQGK
jgi:hypothetical protein